MWKTTANASIDNQKNALDVNVDINKNFNLSTAFGTLPLSVHMEAYVFNQVFVALRHFLDLRLPIKPEEGSKYQKLF
jgi:hypothetical protein